MTVHDALRDLIYNNLGTGNSRTARREFNLILPVENKSDADFRRCFTMYITVSDYGFEIPINAVDDVSELQLTHGETLIYPFYFIKSSEKVTTGLQALCNMLFRARKNTLGNLYKRCFKYTTTDGDIFYAGPGVLFNRTGECLYFMTTKMVKGEEDNKYVPYENIMYMSPSVFESTTSVEKAIATKLIPAFVCYQKTWHYKSLGWKTIPTRVEIKTDIDCSMFKKISAPTTSIDDDGINESAALLASQIYDCKGIF